MSKRNLDDTGYYSSYKKQRVLESKREVAALCYPPIMPLQDISAAKIVTSMLMHNDVQQGINNFFTENTKINRWGEYCRVLLEYKDWIEVVRKVEKRLSSLPIPQSVVQKLLTVTHGTANYIYSWIEYNDVEVLDTKSYSEYSAANYIDNIQWNTRGKIDYLQTAKSILSKENSELSDYDKYKIACNYCLEDYVIALAPKVYLGNSNPIMCGFWSAYVRKRNNETDISGLYKDLHQYNNYRGTNISVNEYVFNSLIGNETYRYIRKNDIPIKYMWNKLTDAEKSRNIKLAMKEIKNADLVYFLFSQLDYEQQQEIFKDHDCAKNILNHLFQESWLEEGFLHTALCMLNVMQGATYLHMLNRMTYYYAHDSRGSGLDNKYKSIFIKLWQAAPQHLKDFVFINKKGKSLHELVTDSSLSWENDIDVIKLILSDMNVQQKNDLLFSRACSKQIEYLVMHDQWHLFENFIKYDCYTKETIDCFKQELIKGKLWCNSYNIAKWFIQNKKWEQIEYFLNWTSIPTEEINEFKRKLMRGCGYGIAKEWIKHKEWEQVEYLLNWAFTSIEEINEFKHYLVYFQIHNLCNDTDAVLEKSAVAEDFSEINYFLKWSLITEDEINLFKMSKLMEDSMFQTLVLQLVSENKCELVERILNWCFSDDLKQVKQFKQNLYKDYREDRIIWLIIELVKHNNQLQALEKFCDWCFTNIEEIKQFQKWSLQPSNKTVGTCIALIWWDYDLSYNAKLKLADQLINWCCNSLKLQVHEFKQRLMIYNNIEYMFQDIIKDILEKEEQEEDQDDSSSDDDDQDDEQNNKTENVDNYQDIKQIIKWFNPLPSTIIKFKEQFIDSNWLKHLVPILDTYLDNIREGQNNNQDIVAQDDICTQVGVKRKLDNEDSDSKVKKLRNNANVSLEEDDDSQHESSQDILVLNNNSDEVINDTNTNSKLINILVHDLLTDIENMIHSTNDSLVNCIGDNIS